MDDLTKEQKIKLTALDRAISAGCGTAYNDSSFAITDADRIIEAAKKFEAYLKDNQNG